MRFKVCVTEGKLLTGNGHTGLMAIIILLIWQLHGINCVLICLLNPNSVSGLSDYKRGCMYVDKKYRSIASQKPTVSNYPKTLWHSFTQPNHPQRFGA